MLSSHSRPAWLTTSRTVPGREMFTGPSRWRSCSCASFDKSVRVRVCVRYCAPETLTSAKCKSPVSRADVASAAVRLVEQQGMDALSVRAVAREVGLSAMSLYTHVRDRDDLADLVVDARIAELAGTVRLPVAWD